MKKLNKRSLICEFAVASGALRVTDPSYQPDVWCAGQIDDVRNGRWLAEVGYYHDPHDKAAIEQHRQHERERIANAIAGHERDGKGSFVAITIIQRLGQELASLEQRWKTFDETDHGRVAYLRVCHESQRDELECDIPDLCHFERTSIEVGVDSAKAGFFDLAAYMAVYENGGQSPSDDAPDAITFQSSIGKLMEANTLFGVIGFGAVSSSGYGDGIYPCFTRADAGEIVDAFILFIEPADKSVQSAQ